MDIRENHPQTYAIDQRYYQSAGPIYSHSRYHLIERDMYDTEGQVIATSIGFSLGRFQAFDYFKQMDDVEFSQRGITYLESIDFIDLLQS